MNEEIEEREERIKEGGGRGELMKGIKRMDVVGRVKDTLTQYEQIFFFLYIFL